MFLPEGPLQTYIASFMLEDTQRPPSRLERDALVPLEVADKGIYNKTNSIRMK